jgi:hypothetical protein
MIYSIVVGLIAGWLAGQVMKGGGYVALPRARHCPRNSYANRREPPAPPVKCATLAEDYGPVDQWPQVGCHARRQSSG